MHRLFQIGTALGLSVVAAPGLAQPVASSDAARATSADDRHFAVHLNPALLVVGSAAMDAAWAPTRHWSVNVGVQVLPNIGLIPAEGFGVVAGTQLFFGGERAFDGWYVYPQFGFLRIKEETETVVQDAGTAGNVAFTFDSRYSAVYGGAVVGYQWTWTMGVSLRVGLGIAYSSIVSRDDIEGQIEGREVVDVAVDDGYDGPIPLGDLALGWAF